MAKPFFRWRRTKEKLDAVQVFNFGFTNSQEYIKEHGPACFVRYEEWRYLKHMYDKLLEETKGK